MLSYTVAVLNMLVQYWWPVSLGAKEELSRFEIPQRSTKFEKRREENDWIPGRRKTRAPWPNAASMGRLEGEEGVEGPTLNIILTILNSATYLKIFCMQQLDMYHFLAVHCAAGSDHFVDLQCLACDRDRDCDALFCCIEKGWECVHCAALKGVCQGR